MVQLVQLATCNLNQWSLDFDLNLGNISRSIREARAMGARFRTGPELEVSGYGCEDHFLEEDTLRHCWESVVTLLSGDLTDDLLVDIGMPIAHKGVRYNCRVFLLNRKIVLIRPKMCLANDGNYREGRWFTAWTRRDLDSHVLPRAVRAVTGQHAVPIGHAVLECDDTTIASETCEELFTPEAPHVELGLNGVEIIANGSGSHHSLRKLEIRLALIRNATSKSGGAYLYANQQGCDGGRLYYDGCASAYLNGEMVSQGSQFSVRDVEVVMAVMDLDEIRSFRGAIASRSIQAAAVRTLPHIRVAYSVCSANPSPFLLPSAPMLPRLHTPEEEIGFGPACWLWDYLRRSGAGGYFLPLSGGADSAATATIVGIMCHLVVRAIAAGDQIVLADARRIAGFAPEDASYTPQSPQELMSRVLHTCYMGTSNSSAETTDRAAAIAKEVGAYHLHVSLDTMVSAVLTTFSALTGRTPKYLVHGGTRGENLALQNIQARLRMVFSYLLAQLLPWVRGRSSYLLVLGSANVDEALRGYMTKYDCLDPDTRLWLANGDTIRAADLLPHHQLLDDEGNAVSIVPNTLIGTVTFPQPGPGQAGHAPNSMLPTPGAVAGNLTRNPGWRPLRVIHSLDAGFDDYTVSEGHLLTVANAEAATVGYGAGMIARAAGWHFPNDCFDSAGAPIHGYTLVTRQRGGWSNIRPYYWPNFPTAGLWQSNLEAAEQKADDWNSYHDLPNTPRVGELTVDTLESVPSSVFNRLSSIKLSQPIVFPVNNYLLGHLSLALLQTGAVGGVIGGVPIVCPVTFRAAAIEEAMRLGGMDAVSVALRATLNEQLFRDPANNHVAVHPPTSAELAAHATPVQLLLDYILEVTAWVIGLWIADGDSNGMAVTQSLQTQFGLNPAHPIANCHSGVFQRCRHWLVLLGLGAQYRESLHGFGVPPVGGGAALPVSYIWFHAAVPLGGAVGNTNVLLNLLVSMDVVIVAAPRNLNKPRFTNPALPNRIGWQNETPNVRLSLLAGLIDGDGWYAPNTQHSYRFSSQRQELSLWVSTLFRQLGWVTARPFLRTIPNPTWWVDSISAEFDQQREMDLAIHYKRTVPRGKRVQTPHLSRFRIDKFPAPGNGPMPVVAFQVQGGNGTGRFLLADGTVTHNCSSADVNPIGGVSKGDLKRFLIWASTAFPYPTLRDVVAAKPTAELEPITADYTQSDEVDMGMSYEELGIYGRLRKIYRCGPVSMYQKLVALWGQKHPTNATITTDHASTAPRGEFSPTPASSSATTAVSFLPPHAASVLSAPSLTPSQVAAKVQAFFYFYSANRHKLTTLTPSYHAENYAPDDNRFDHRQFLYNTKWRRQVDVIQAMVARDEAFREAERRRDEDAASVGSANRKFQGGEGDGLLVTQGQAQL